MKKWQLQDAKARLSEVVRKAISDGPQEITLHGAPAVVVISADDYRQLAEQGQEESDMADFFLNSPLRGSKLDLRRDKSPARDVDLFGPDD